jgi:hypothetical protein
MIKYPKHTVKDYILGAKRSAPFEVINESGDWRPYLPVYEQQRKRIETFGCSNFGSLSEIEILENYIENKDSNYSERFTAVMSGQTKNGNDPHKVMESIRRDGVVDEKDLPFTSGMSFGEYLSPKPMRHDLIEKGKNWVYEHVFKHEYIYPIGAPVEERKRLLKEALKRSPVGVSVYAWQKENGLYTKPQGIVDNHWCVLVAIVDDVPIVFDSYEPSLKPLTWDHFDIAKGVFLKYVPEKKSLIITIIQALIKLFNLQIVEMKKKTLGEQLYHVALHGIGTDVSPKDYAPDELSCAESVSSLVRKVLLDFPIITGTWTLLDYMKDDRRFVPTKIPKPGTIIISATGTGNGTIRGHAGICGQNLTIMSADYRTGLFMSNFTIDTWTKRYKDKGGMAIKMFDIVA